MIPRCTDGTRDHLWVDEPDAGTAVLVLAQYCEVCWAGRFVYDIGGREVVRYGRAPRQEGDTPIEDNQKPY